MHTVTFYSFKGGVGRTMALVNVAAQLLAKGRRVLVVDFDLEAPGIGTYDLFRSAKGPGIVDYVSEYLRTGAAPDARDFLTDCGAAGTKGQLWAMAAGRQDAAYAGRLNSIDWQRLYKEEDGFLMFEDLKAQWKERLHPDYVLIDSRTGHTDVGGICTRQLPDAVVILFTPNKQNLAGLQTLVADIRKEAEPPRNKPIHLHFVPANIPELDDEEGIVKNALDLARQSLAYDEPAAIIHHYSSLSLLNQPVFVLERPRTRLSKEYEGLTAAIVRENVMDREGALAYLRRLHVALEEDRWHSMADGREMEERLRLIASNHTQDGEILARMAEIRESLGDWENGLALLTASIEAGHKTATVLRRRAEIYRALSRTQEAIADFRAALEVEGADFSDIYIAVRSLSELDPESLKGIEWAPSVSALGARDRVRLASEAMARREVLPVVERMIRGISRELEPALKSIARSTLVITLIGQKRFREAMDSIATDREGLLTKAGVSSVFNYAMAEWALTGRPPLDLFRRVVELDVDTGIELGPNYAQCLAVATYFAKGQVDATPWIEKARRGIKSNPIRTFSCWRYLEVPASEFEEDLRSIERLFNGEEVQPLFMLNPGDQPDAPDQLDLLAPEAPRLGPTKASPATGNVSGSDTGAGPDKQ